MRRRRPPPRDPNPPVRDPNAPPSSPLFANAPGASPPQLGDFPGTAQDQQFVAQLEQLIASGQLGPATNPPLPRADQFLPYLLLRAFPGDHGTRPQTQPCWESCDIWTAPGDPASAPAVPSSVGGVVAAGQPNTVYAHVWNLGIAPLAGVRVEFYWFDPSVMLPETQSQLIGMTRVDLAPKISPQCHRLVKCPKPWVPVFANGGHECLLVRIEGIGDPIGANAWDPSLNRHVAQRNITVVQQAQNVSALVASLTASVSPTARVEISQVGAEARHAVQIVAPQLRVDASIKTMPLATLERGTVTVHSISERSPRILPHALLDHGVPLPAASPRITPAVHTVPDAGLGTLIAHSALFDPAVIAQIVPAAPPPPGSAQVLRIAHYEGARVTGGYTIVITGKR